MLDLSVSWQWLYCSLYSSRISWICLSCRIWGSHSRNYEEFYLAGCNTIWTSTRLHGVTSQKIALSMNLICYILLLLLSDILVYGLRIWYFSLCWLVYYEVPLFLSNESSFNEFVEFMYKLFCYLFQASGRKRALQSTVFHSATISGKDPWCTASRDKIDKIDHRWTVYRAVCKTSDTVCGNFPLIRIAISSAYPTVKWPVLLSSQRRSSTTRLHSRGERTPPCGHSLTADALRVTPDNVSLIFLLSSIPQIHLQITGSMPCLSAVCFIVSKEVLSRNPPRHPCVR